MWLQDDRGKHERVQGPKSGRGRQTKVHGDLWKVLDQAGPSRPVNDALGCQLSAVNNPWGTCNQQTSQAFLMLCLAIIVSA